MPIFSYSAAGKDGKAVKGEKEAADEKELAKTLKQEGLFLLEAGEKASLLNFNINLRDITSRFKPIGLVEKMFFAKNLSVMISAGLPLTRALEALADESSNPKFKKIMRDVNESVIKGKSFAESLRIHEKVFGPLFISMVEVGEMSGKLTLVLKLLANQMKKDNDIRRRVKGAMIYPAIVVVTLIGIGAFMLLYIVPTLSNTIKELGVDLPVSTQIVIKISDLVVNYSLLVLLGLISFVVLFWKLLKTKRGKGIYDRFILKFPIFGPLVRKFNSARFCRTLAYLITSGVPIVRSLEITSSVLGNSLFKQAALDSSLEIQKGKQLHEILGNYRTIFQPIVIQMINVGEETGKISDMMLRLAMFFEEEVNSTTKNLSTVIEPLLMVIIGGMVGFFAVAMLQPIYGSLGNIKN